MSIISKMRKTLKNINPDYEKQAVDMLKDNPIVSDVLNYEGLLAGYAISKDKLIIVGPTTNLKLDVKDIKAVQLKLGKHIIDMGNYHYEIKPAPITSNLDKYKLLIKALNDR
jgi:6-phosphogluconate dehydrogenase (decarboxylating)